MKDSPEHELFRKIEHRLRNYTEQPDYVLWSNISNALEKKRESRWIIWFERVGALGAVLMFLLLAGNDVNNNPSEISFNKDEQLITLQRESSSGVGLNVHTHDQEYSNASNKMLPSADNEVSITVQQNTSGNETKVYKEADDISDTDSAEPAQADVESDSLMNSPEEITQTKAEAGTIIKDVKRIIRKNNLRLSVSLTPLLTFRKIVPHGNDNVVINTVTAPPVFSSSRLGWQFNAGLQGNLSRRWEYEAGLSLYRQQQTFEYGVSDPDHVMVDQVSDGVYDVFPGVAYQSLQYNMLNAGAQVGVFYTLKPSRLMHKMGVGASYQLGMLKASFQQEYVNNQSQYFSYQLMYRLQYAMSKQVQIYLQPQFSHILWAKENVAAPFTTKVHHGGIGIGAIILLSR